MSKKKMKLEHVPGIFYTKTSHGTAEVRYRIKDNVMQIYYTYVPEQDRGKNIAEKLTIAAFDFARGNSYRVEPQCAYTLAFVERHEEYKRYTEISSENKPTHPTTVAQYPGSLEELAKDIAQMRYDAVAEFFGYFAREIQKQEEADKERGREQLSVKLGNSAHFLDELVEEISAAWKICKPHMKKKD
jgi:predicted GNAT family acetyltransferase